MFETTRQSVDRRGGQKGRVTLSGERVRRAEALPTRLKGKQNSRCGLQVGRCRVGFRSSCQYSTVNFWRTPGQASESFCAGIRARTRDGDNGQPRGASWVAGAGLQVRGLTCRRQQAGTPYSTSRAKKVIHALSLRSMWCDISHRFLCVMIRRIFSRFTFLVTSRGIVSRAVSFCTLIARSFCQMLRGP